jgi:hypothetical protein
MSLDARLSPEVDLEHPWLGLESFSEITRSYFFGRDVEAAELLQRLRLHPLLVLYGRCGLGKTSLLRARLVPDLEKLGARPAFYRISFRKGEDSPLEQGENSRNGNLRTLASVRTQLRERYSCFNISCLRIR